MKSFKSLFHLFVAFIVLWKSEHFMVSSEPDGFNPNNLISKGKEVSQSSEYSPSPGPAKFAVDGDKNQNYGTSCTHTNLQTNPWWKVDLGSNYYIYGLKVWNRADCCGERLTTLKVQTSNDNVNFYDVDDLKVAATNGGVYSFVYPFTGRYVRLMLGKPTADYLTICEVEIYGRPKNIGAVVSKGKSVSQSSEYTPSPGPANVAIDGNTQQNYFSRSCTHTGLQVNPWWKIDLGSEHDINLVKVWNRGDCCGERLTSLKLQASNNNVNFYDVGVLSGSTTNGGVYSFTQAFNGRYVRLTLSKSTADYLTLCEVQLYGRARQTSDVVSKGKQAKQSSEYSPQPGRANNAVDGQTNQNYFAHSCTHTDHQVNPWWRVDLGSIHRIYAVKVWNRGDCCGERLTSLKVQTSYDDKSFYDVDILKENAANSAVYTFTKPFNGRFVRLILSKLTADYLTLCEVVVYGYPDD